MRAAPAALLLLLGACAPADGPPDGAGPGRSGMLPVEALAARLPDGVAGFARGDTTWHERERPGLGVTVDYAGPARAAVATVGLYDRGEGAVPDDPDSPRLRQEFAAAIAEVVALAGTRTSQHLAERERSALPVPGGAALNCARLEGSYGRQQVQTLVCVGGAAGHFLKVLVTAPARQVQPVDALPFVTGIARAARGQG